MSDSIYEQCYCRNCRDDRGDFLFKTAEECFADGSHLVHKDCEDNCLRCGSDEQVFKYGGVVECYKAGVHNDEVDGDGYCTQCGHDVDSDAAARMAAEEDGEDDDDEEDEEDEDEDEEEASNSAPPAAVIEVAVNYVEGYAESDAQISAKLFSSQPNVQNLPPPETVNMARLIEYMDALRRLMHLSKGDAGVGTLAEHNHIQVLNDRYLELNSVTREAAAKILDSVREDGSCKTAMPTEELQILQNALSAAYRNIFNVVSARFASWLAMRLTDEPGTNRHRTRTDQVYFLETDDKLYGYTVDELLRKRVLLSVPPSKPDHGLAVLQRNYSLVWVDVLGKYETNKDDNGDELHGVVVSEHPYASLKKGASVSFKRTEVIDHVPERSALEIRSLRDKIKLLLPAATPHQLDKISKNISYREEQFAGFMSQITAKFYEREDGSERAAS